MLAYEYKRLYRTSDILNIYCEEGMDREKMMYRMMLLAREGYVRPVIDSVNRGSTRLYDYDGVVDVGVALTLRELEVPSWMIKRCLRRYGDGTWLPSSAGYLVGYLKTLKSGSRLCVEINIAEIEARIDQYTSEEVRT
jgi:hypothetical protein